MAPTSNREVSEMADNKQPGTSTKKAPPTKVEPEKTASANEEAEDDQEDTIGEGFTVQDKGDRLVIEIMKEPKGVVSASGKSIVIATTRGNRPSGLRIGKKDLIISVNAYVKK
jgi:hypothetical protein